MTENNLAAEAVQVEEAVASPAPETAAPVAETAPATPEPAAPEAGEKNDGDDKQRNRRSAQERIAQLTRQKRERDEEIARLREKLAKPPKQEDFSDFDAYEREKVKHAVQEALADDLTDRAKAEQERIAQAVKAQWTESVEAFKATAPDFEQVVYRTDVPITPGMAETVMLMGEDGARVAYHLAKNVHEAARIAALPDRIAAAEMGRLAAELRAPPRRVVSSAPPPVAPVVSAGGPVNKSPAEMTQAEYNAWRRGQR